MASGGGSPGGDAPLCTVCQDTPSNPHLLPCNDIFCKYCLQKLLAHARNPSSFSCLDCHSKIRVGEGCVSDVQKIDLALGQRAHWRFTSPSGAENAVWTDDYMPEDMEGEFLAHVLNEEDQWSGSYGHRLSESHHQDQDRAGFFSYLRKAFNTVFLGTLEHYLGFPLTHEKSRSEVDFLESYKKSHPEVFLETDEESHEKVHDMPEDMEGEFLACALNEEDWWSGSDGHRLSESHQDQDREGFFSYLRKAFNTVFLETPEHYLGFPLAHEETHSEVEFLESHKKTRPEVFLENDEESHEEVDDMPEDTEGEFLARVLNEEGQWSGSNRHRLSESHHQDRAGLFSYLQKAFNTVLETPEHYLGFPLTHEETHSEVDFLESHKKTHPEDFLETDEESHEKVEFSESDENDLEKALQEFFDSYPEEEEVQTTAEAICSVRVQILVLCVCVMVLYGVLGTLRS